jgi:hypothetical protein
MKAKRSILLPGGIYDRIYSTSVEAVQYADIAGAIQIITRLLDNWDMPTKLITPALKIGDWVVYDPKLPSVTIVSDETFKRCYKEK